MPCLPLRPINLAVGSLYFNDGSQKALAGFVVWLSLLLASEGPEITEADLQHPQVVNLVASLLQIPTSLKASVCQGDEFDSAISRIVRQNCDSKVQPVSSLTWASILMTLGDGGNLETAMQRYNSHPDVAAFEGEGGVGSISLDGRKKQVPLPNNYIHLVFFQCNMVPI